MGIFKKVQDSIKFQNFQNFQKNFKTFQKTFEIFENLQKYWKTPIFQK